MLFVTLDGVTSFGMQNAMSEADFEKWLPSYLTHRADVERFRDLSPLNFCGG